MVRTNPIVIFRLPMIPTDHFHPNAGLFGILRKSVIWPLPSVNFVISSLIWTSWDTAEVSVSFFGALKHLWFCILVGAIHRFHNGSVNHSNRNSARPRWNCIVGNHEKLYDHCLTTDKHRHIQKRKTPWRKVFPEIDTTCIDLYCDRL